MKKIFFAVVVTLLLIVQLSVTTFAAEAPSFQFELSVDGSDSKEVQTGDIITVTLRLKRTDTADSYTMFAMQDEIRYDSNFFELVEDGTMLSPDIVSTDISMRDHYREFYMNYLSTSGGTEWEPDMLIGSFQLRVIGTSGVAQITNQDYLVSTQDGLSSYACEANELTVILTTECTVRFESNGGSPVNDQVVQYGEKVVQPDDPTREGYSFAGWYKDIDQMEAWDFENDVVSGNMTLYAGWADAASDPSVTESNDNNNGWFIIAAVVLLILILLLFWYRKKMANTRGENAAIQPGKVAEGGTSKQEENKSDNR